MTCINADLLKSKMYQNGYRSNESLANEIGVNRDTIGNILTGRVYPSYPVINGIFYALKLTPEEATSIFFANKLTQDVS